MDTRLLLPYFIGIAFVLKHAKSSPCENQYCPGPEFSQSSCCPGYDCVSRSWSKTPNNLLCVNSQNRLRVLSFDEIIESAKSFRPQNLWEGEINAPHEQTPWHRPNPRDAHFNSPPGLKNQYNPTQYHSILGVGDHYKGHNMQYNSPLGPRDHVTPHHPQYNSQIKIDDPYNPYPFQLSPPSSRQFTPQQLQFFTPSDVLINLKRESLRLSSDPGSGIRDNTKINQHNTLYGLPDNYNTNTLEYPSLLLRDNYNPHYKKGIAIPTFYRSVKTSIRPDSLQGSKNHNNNLFRGANSNNGAFEGIPIPTKLSEGNLQQKKLLRDAAQVIKQHQRPTYTVDNKHNVLKNKNIASMHDKIINSVIPADYKKEKRRKIIIALLSNLAISNKDKLINDSQQIKGSYNNLLTRQDNFSNQVIIANSPSPVVRTNVESDFQKPEIHKEQKYLNLLKRITMKRESLSPRLLNDCKTSKTLLDPNSSEKIPQRDKTDDFVKCIKRKGIVTLFSKIATPYKDNISNTSQYSEEDSNRLLLGQDENFQQVVGSNGTDQAVTSSSPQDVVVSNNIHEAIRNNNIQDTGKDIDIETQKIPQGYSPDTTLLSTNKNNSRHQAKIVKKEVNLENKRKKLHAAMVPELLMTEEERSGSNLRHTESVLPKQNITPTQDDFSHHHANNSVTGNLVYGNITGLSLKT